MLKQAIGLAFCITVFAMGVAAQTTVTNNNDGAAGTLPIYTGSAALGNSVITQSNGNVGIGTTSPLSPLVVTGTNYQPTTAVISVGTVNTGCNGCGFTALQLNSLAEASQSANVGLSVDVGNGEWNYAALFNGGNVGIGTTNPYALLDIKATGGYTSPVIELEQDNAANSGYRLGIDDALNGDLVFSRLLGGTAVPSVAFGRNTSGVLIGKDYAGSYSSPTNGLVVEGNVGIGTTAPAYPLDVSGQIHSSGGIMFPDGSTQTSAYNQVASGSNVITQNNGNVGIGTTTPTSPLVVSGTTGSAGTTAVITSNPQNPGCAGCNWTALQINAQTVTPQSENVGLSVNVGNGGSNYAALFNGGNVGIGTTAPGMDWGTGSTLIAPVTASNPGGTFPIAAGTPVFEVTGDIALSQGTYAAGHGGGIIFSDGTVQTTAFNQSNCGADYAEAVDVTGDRTSYAPGDLLVIDPDAPGKFLKSNQPYSQLIAGVYSTKPGFVGRLQPPPAEGQPEFRPGYVGRLRPQTAAVSEAEVPMAMVGRVPTKVSAENGPIKVGDLLVSSATVGYAMKGTDRSQMLGAVVGKALGSLDSGTGTIMVLVTLQ